MADTPKTVKVRALQAHSYNGKNYDVGDTYDLDAQLLDSLRIQGKAESADTPHPPAAKPSKPVEPMTMKATAKRARLTAKPKGKRK